MTEVMNTCEPGMEDFSVPAATGNPSISFQIFPDSHERYPKLSKRLPSIVVEPTESGEVESGSSAGPLMTSAPQTSPGDPAALLQPGLAPKHSQVTDKELSPDSEDSQGEAGAVGGDSN